MARVTLRADATDRGPALLLRPWEAADIAALTEVVRGDPLLRRWTNLPANEGEDAARWLSAQREGRTAGDRFGFAVTEDRQGRDGGRLVAGVVLKRPAPDGPAAEVGYWTAAPARGRGVASRALDALTAWAFRTFTEGGLERLELLHQVDNTASCRVAEKSGFTFAEVLPPHPPHPLEGHLHVRTACQ